jgi:hypothetical protein
MGNMEQLRGLTWVGPTSSQSTIRERRLAASPIHRPRGRETRWVRVTDHGERTVLVPASKPAQKGKRDT